MHYYRFRPSGELAIKELMYDEIYFASSTECNDPFDGKAFLSFVADSDRWRRLLEIAWKGLNNTDKPKWVEQLSVHLAGLAPLTYDATLGLDFVKVLLSLPSPPDPYTSVVLSEHVKRFLRLYKPKDIYFVSFSRICNDPLMWAHYAAMHRGHCLIFKAIDGHLYQCPRRKKKSIRRNTQAGLAPSMSYSIPDSFPFRDVSYSSDAIPNDAFCYFPEYVFGRKLKEEEKNELITRQNQQYLVKHKCWSYEEESRLTLSSPEAWLLGESVNYSAQERLFYYQSNQLVGVILGARMDVQQKMRFREIIKDRMDRIAHDPGDNAAIFNFILFQAILPDNRREIAIEAEEIFTLSNTLGKNDSNFERYLHEWREGWALVLNGASGSRKRFL